MGVNNHFRVRIVQCWLSEGWIIHCTKDPSPNSKKSEPLRKLRCQVPGGGFRDVTNCYLVFSQ